MYEGALAAIGKHGLTLRPPRLTRPDGGFTVAGLTFVFFARHVGEVKTKRELTDFLRGMRCQTTDPQPRHLGAQAGFQFLVQGCWHPTERRQLRAGEYCLLDLESEHPNHACRHRSIDRALASPDGFGGLKALYGDRCAVCGSSEGEPHLKNLHLITMLERGHCDPRRPLTQDNCLPMCTMCNRVYRDRAVFNRRGFVVAWVPAPAAMAAAAGGGDAGDGDEPSFDTGAVAGRFVVRGVRVRTRRAPLAAASHAASEEHRGPVTRSRARLLALRASEEEEGGRG